jgi:hypothetical protein
LNATTSARSNSAMSELLYVSNMTFGTLADEAEWEMTLIYRAAEHNMMHF